MSRRLQSLLNLHVGLWLCKDLSWCSEWRWVGLAVTAPTIFVAFKIVRECEDPEDIAFNTAACFWVLANATWMIGEFFFADKLRIPAQALFVLGILTLARHYLRRAA